MAPAGGRVYVADQNNHRIQYFRDEPPRAHAKAADRPGNGLLSSTDNTGVSPASLGRVKALFK